MLNKNYAITLLICYNTTENNTNENKYYKNKEAKIAFLSSMLIHSIFIAPDKRNSVTWALYPHSPFCLPNHEVGWSQLL